MNFQALILLSSSFFVYSIFACKYTLIEIHHAPRSFVPLQSKWNTIILFRLPFLYFNFTIWKQGFTLQICFICDSIDYSLEGWKRERKKEKKELKQRMRERLFESPLFMLHCKAFFPLFSFTSFIRHLFSPSHIDIQTRI